MIEVPIARANAMIDETTDIDAIVNTRRIEAVANPKDLSSDGTWET